MLTCYYINGKTITIKCGKLDGIYWIIIKLIVLNWRLMYL